MSVSVEGTGTISKGKICSFITCSVGKFKGIYKTTPRSIVDYIKGFVKTPRELPEEKKLPIHCMVYKEYSFYI